MITWFLTCRRDRLERLRRKRADKARARKIRDAQRAALERLGSRALIPPTGQSRFLYRP